MIVRTATRFEFPTGPAWFYAFLFERVERRFVFDSEDKDVWIYICYVSGGPW